LSVTHPESGGSDMGITSEIGTSGQSRRIHINEIGVYPCTRVLEVNWALASSEVRVRTSRGVNVPRLSAALHQVLA
jgi:hypothetical protein